MTRFTWSSTVVMGGVLVLVASVGLGLVAQTIPEPAGSNPVRLVQMQHHFLEVSRIHEAIIRGDLKSVRAPAMQLSQLPTPPGIPAAGLPFLVSIRQAAGRAASAATLVRVLLGWPGRTAPVATCALRASSTSES